MASIRVSFIAPYDLPGLRLRRLRGRPLNRSRQRDADQMVALRDCGLVFQNPRLTGQSLRALYAKADYFGLRGSNNRMLWDARGDLGRGLVGELTHGRGSGGLL